MKSLKRVVLALLCLALTKTLPAQNSPFTNFADSVFQHLDKSFITTGILYDRAFPLLNLHGFNAQTDTTSSDFFEQAYFELYNAVYARNTFLNPDDLTYIREVENFQNKVPVSVMDYKFNWIDTLAVEHNLISLQNGLYYDVNGRTQSPYIEKRVQLVSPLFEELKPGTIIFSFDPYLTFTNQSVTVQQIQLNFPGVGTATLLPNGTASLNFASAKLRYPLRYV